MRKRYYRRSPAVRRRDRERLGDAPFSIVANDCWAAEVYKHVERPYNTPFVGLFVFGPDFTRLVRNLEPCLREPLKFGVASRYVVSPDYPVGVVGDDVEMHFLHYASPAEAEQKWYRRLERFDWSAVRVKVDRGKDLIDDATLDAVRAAPGGLVLGPTRRSPRDVAVRFYTVNGRALFHRSIRHFDLVEWLRTGAVRPAPGYSRLLP